MTWTKKDVLIIKTIITPKTEETEQKPKFRGPQTRINKGLLLKTTEIPYLFILFKKKRERMRGTLKKECIKKRKG